LWLAASAGGAALAAGLRTGVSLGVGAGVLYAAGDVATKAVAGGRFLFVPLLLAAHGLAFVCLQIGFQRGRALTTIGLATLLTNALPIAAGIVVFHERLPGGIAGELRLTAFALVTVCAAVLARPD